MLASTLSEAQAGPHIEGVNNVFSNQFGILGPLETWIMLDKLYEAFLFIYFRIAFSCFQTSPQPRQLFRRILLFFLCTTRPCRLSISMGVSR